MGNTASVDLETNITTNNGFEGRDILTKSINKNGRTKINTKNVDITTHEKGIKEVKFIEGYGFNSFYEEEKVSISLIL